MCGFQKHFCAQINISLNYTPMNFSKYLHLGIGFKTSLKLVHGSGCIPNYFKMKPEEML